MEKHPIPAELKQAICNNQLIVFVGAGLSYKLINKNGQPLKGWSNLVEQILNDLKSKSYDVDHLLPLVEKYDPIKVLDLIESDRGLPRKEILNFIKDYLELDDDRNDYGLHQKLHKLSPKLVTTNYDTAFERAVPELRKYKAYKGKNYELTTHKDQNAALLFKLHGCFEDADSMILFPSNYTDLYNNPNIDAEHSLLVLKNIILNNSVLFVGTGVGDFQINNLFQEVKKIQGEYNQKHFIITNRSLDSSLNFLTALKVKDYSEIEEFIEVLISMKEECGNNESNEIIELREQLLAANKRLEELESGAIRNNDKLLEREALRYFSKGVEWHLSNEPGKAINEYKTALELKPDLHEALNNWGTYLGNLAKTKEGKESEALYHEAFEKFKKAIEIKPDKHEAFNNWGTYLGNLADTKEGKEAEVLYHEAIDKFKKAIEIKPDEHEAFYNWGTDLGNLAKTKEGKESESLYHEAFEKFKKAIEIKPDEHDAFYNWGTYLGNLADTKEGKESESLYHEAFEKFKKAIGLKPDKHEAFYNWGTYLGNLADTKEGKESEALYHEAFEKFKKAIGLKPDKHEAFNNWGTLLGTLADTKEGKESEALYSEAFEKFKKAIEIKPDKHETFNNWGALLGNLADTKEGKESEALYHEAFEKFKKAIELGASHYNLACLYAIRKVKKEALDFLKLSLTNKEIPIEYVLEDDDWENYLQDEEFLAIINKNSN